MSSKLRFERRSEGKVVDRRHQGAIWRHLPTAMLISALTLPAFTLDRAALYSRTHSNMTLANKVATESTSFLESRTEYPTRAKARRNFWFRLTATAALSALVTIVFFKTNIHNVLFKGLPKDPDAAALYILNRAPVMVQVLVQHSRGVMLKFW